MFKLRKCSSLILVLLFCLNVIKGQNQGDSKKTLPGHRALEMCKKYSKVARGCSLTNIPLILVPRVHEGEFPHLVQIGYQEKQETTVKWLCGGGLISESFVLSAAHCMRIPSTGERPKFVRTGNIYGSSKMNVQVRNVVTIFVHPGFTYNKRYNDLAVIKVDKPFDFNDYVRPGCLHIEKKIPESKVIHTGWTTWSYVIPEEQMDLIKVNVNIVVNEICNKTFGNRFENGVDEDKLICTEIADRSKYDCQPEIDGLLQIIRNDTDDIKCMYDVVGVPLFTSACIPHVPSVYTRVSNYINWIEEIVWKH